MDDIFALEALEKMDKTVESLHHSLATLRTGRASASVLDRIDVDYYGEKTPIYQLSSISTPEPTQLLIKPYDRNDVKSIVAAINASDLGINPINDGTSIRLVFPAPTEERRRELAKHAKKYCEDAKVAIRNIRRDVNTAIKKDDSLTEDEVRRSEEAVQKVTDEMTKKIDEIFKEKENEIMKV
ncbi:MAG: ribosome recycling factor [Bacilli bacterium]|jgi:ribosome recycling factor